MEEVEGLQWEGLQQLYYLDLDWAGPPGDVPPPLQARFHVGFRGLWCCVSASRQGEADRKYLVERLCNNQIPIDRFMTAIGNY